jgi:carbamate kinase
MRVLVAAGESQSESIAALVAAGRHQVVIAATQGTGGSLELDLRNALPGEEVVAVPMRVIVDGERPSRPQALLGLHSVRALIAVDATVICALGALPPVTICSGGEMREVDAKVSEESALDLLARRLDAERLIASEELVEALGYARPE